MNEEQMNELLKYFTQNWLKAGIVAGIICTAMLTRTKLKKDGFLTLGDILMGVLLMGLFTAGGWLTLVFLGFLFKEHLDEILKVKLFTTKEFKTKNLLYKEEDND